MGLSSLFSVNLLIKKLVLSACGEEGGKTVIEKERSLFGSRLLWPFEDISQALWAQHEENLEGPRSG